MITIPSIAQLSQTIISQLEASFSQTIPLLPRSFTRILGKVVAGSQILSYKYAGWGILQAFVATASFDECTINGKTIRPLVEWGRLLGAGDPRAAVDAEVVVSCSVLNQTGSIAQGQKLTYGPSQVTYEVAFEVVLSSPTVQLTLRPVSGPNGTDGSGSVGNIAAGEKLSFAGTPTNVVSTVTVVYQTITGADAETADEYRARVLRRAKAKPQGGALADYRAWGEEVSGIANVYPYRGQPGEIDVYVEATVESYGNVDGIPNAGQLTQVLNSILYENPADVATQLATRSPANDWVNVYPIRRSGFGVRIYGEVSTSYRAELEQAADEYFRSLEPFILGISALPRNDKATTAGVSAALEGVIASHGESATVIEMREGNINGPIVDWRHLYISEKTRLADGASGLWLPGDP